MQFWILGGNKLSPLIWLNNLSLQKEKKKETQWWKWLAYVQQLKASTLLEHEKDQYVFCLQVQCCPFCDSEKKNTK